MKLVRTEEAVGHVLCHDMTQIIPGVTKDARFRKGHVVTEADIPVTRRRKFCLPFATGKIPAGRRRRKKGRLN